MYVWLARRFPESFTDLEEARARLAVTQELIEESLQRMAERAEAQGARIVGRRLRRGTPTDQQDQRVTSGQDGARVAAALAEKARRLRGAEAAAADSGGNDTHAPSGQAILDAPIPPVNAAPRATLHAQLERHRKQEGLARGSPEYLQSVRDMLRRVSLAELDHSYDDPYELEDDVDAEAASSGRDRGTDPGRR